MQAAGNRLGFLEFEEAEIRGCARVQSGGEPGVASGAKGESVPGVAPGAAQHLCGTEDAVDGAKGGAGEVGFARLPDDLVGAGLDGDVADGIEAWRRGGGGGGVGDVVNSVEIERAVQESEQGRGDVDGVGDQADLELREIEHAPEDVIVSIEELGAGVTQMRETGGAGVSGLFQEAGGGIGVAEVDAATEVGRELDGGDGAHTFRGESEEQGLGAGGGAQFADMIGGGLRHERGVVSSAVAGFGREERAFEVPAGDGGGELGELRTQLAELLEPADQPRPLVGNEGEEIAAATGLVQGASGLEERGRGEIVLLEVDAGEAIDLQVDQGRGEPGQGGGWLRGGIEGGDQAVVPGEFDRLAGGVKPGAEGRHGDSLGWGLRWRQAQ